MKALDLFTFSSLCGKGAATWAQLSSRLSSYFLEKEKNWALAMKLWQAYWPSS